MIESILDMDLYKFSTSNAYFQLYPLAEGTFTFKDRANEDWRGTDFGEEMQLAIAKLAHLYFDNVEKDWCIKNISYIPRNYWEWLQTFRFDLSKINMFIDGNGVFQCKVTDYIYAVTLWEIVIMASYTEVRNKVLGINAKIDDIINILSKKIEFANTNNIFFSEFGTRRRYSSYVQDEILKYIKKHSLTCTGTSNVYFAKKYGMTPIGTFPHEWVQFHAGIFGYKRANYLSLEDWAKAYDGNLGIALVDTYTTKSFLRTLTRKQAHLFAGFRQDSGDEFIVGSQIIRRLQEFNIDPCYKMIVFSNSLDFTRANEIKNYFNGRIKTSFGIGTNLTCDPGIEGYKPANIVMKLSRCRMSDKDPWEKCIKISDDAGKHMGDEKEFEIAKYELHLNE